MCMKNFIVKKFISTYESFDSQWEENKLSVVVIPDKNYWGCIINFQIAWA